MASECSTDSSEVVNKMPRTSLFGHYKKSAYDDGIQRRDRILSEYLEAINSDSFGGGDEVFINRPYSALSALFSRIFCVPASSAPVERIFSQSGLIMRPNRARMSDSVLESLVFLKCNCDL